MQIDFYTGCGELEAVSKPAAETAKMSGATNDQEHIVKKVPSLATLII
jgi:hypothetical protein